MITQVSILICAVVMAAVSATLMIYTPSNSLTELVLLKEQEQQNLHLILPEQNKFLRFKLMRQAWLRFQHTVLQVIR